jgi:polysaccharide pyruvyl transferase WcaK-like protein
MARDGVYLYGYYGQGNLGDDLLLASAVRMIRAHRSRSPILVHCHDPARLPALGDPDLVPVAASARLAEQGRSRIVRLRDYRRDLAAAFGRCDAFVFGGGTVFQDQDSPASLVIIAATVAMAKRHGLQVAAIGAGVGRLRTAVGRVAMKAILTRADCFCVRDEASEAACLALAPRASLRRTADLVHALEVGPSPGANRLGVALSIQPAATARMEATGARCRAALAAVVGAEAGAGRPARLLAFETKAPGAGGLDDAAAWRDVAGGSLAAHPDLVAIGAPASAMDAVAALAAAEAHVGMRYHGHVLSALAGTPFVGIAHDPKVRAICDRFGMPCLDAAEAEPARVLAAVKEAKRRGVDASVLAALRAEALANGAALGALLGPPR